MKHHKQMRQNVPSMEKLREAQRIAERHAQSLRVQENIAEVAATEWPKIAEAVAVPAPVPTWATRLRRALGRAIMRLAAWFRRRS